MKSTILIVMLLTILSKVLGFGREVTLSYFYGASNISDAYLISVTIPTVIFGFIVAGMGASYIPMYSKIEQKFGTGEADGFTSNLVNVLIVVCTVIVLLAMVFMNTIVHFFALGFEGDTFVLAVILSRITLLAIYFTGAVSIFSNYLQIKQNYTIPSLVGLPFNVMIVISIILSRFYGPLALAAGFVIATGAQMTILYTPLKKKQYAHQWTFNFRDEHIVKMFHIALPVIFGMSVNQINTLVDRTLASRLAVGGISALNYANRLNWFILGIFVLSINTVVYPIISRQAAEGKADEFKKTIGGVISSINLFIIPVTMGAMLFSRQIVTMLFGRGAFDAYAINMTAYALFFYSIGMVGFGLRDILSRVFFSMQDTKTPMINGAIGVAVNIVLNLILSRFLGIGGLALATSIAALLTAGLMFASLHKKIGPFGMKRISVSFGKILLASLVMGGAARISFFYATSQLSRSIALTLAIGVGLITYLTIIHFMRIREVDTIVGAIKKKIQSIISQNGGGTE